MGSEFCRRIGGDPKVGGMDFNRGGQRFSWLPSSNSLVAISFHCYIQSFLFMIALCLITDILGQKPIAVNRRTRSL